MCADLPHWQPPCLAGLLAHHLNAPSWGSAQLLPHHRDAVFSGCAWAVQQESEEVALPCTYMRMLSLLVARATYIALALLNSAKVLVARQCVRQTLLVYEDHTKLSAGGRQTGTHCVYGSLAPESLFNPVLANGLVADNLFLRTIPSPQCLCFVTTSATGHNTIDRHVFTINHSTMECV